MAVVIDVVLPCLNEADALPSVLARMPSGYHAIVVDNGSADNSKRIATACGATVVTALPAGFGVAAHAGLLAATTDVVCFMDADGSLDPRELDRVAGPIVAGERDLMLGRRCATVRGAFPGYARLGNSTVAWRLRREGLKVRDLGPMRAAKRAALLDLGILDRRFGWPLEMLVRAGRAGWRVGEVDVSYGPRAGGRSKVTGSLRGSLLAARDMSRLVGRVG